MEQAGYSQQYPNMQAPQYEIEDSESEEGFYETCSSEQFSFRPAATHQVIRRANNPTIEGQSRYFGRELINLETENTAGLNRNTRINSNNQNAALNNKNSGFTFQTYQQQQQYQQNNNQPRGRVFEQTRQRNQHANIIGYQSNKLSDQNLQRQISAEIEFLPNQQTSKLQYPNSMNLLHVASDSSPEDKENIPYLGNLKRSFSNTMEVESSQSSGIEHSRKISSNRTSRAPDYCFGIDRGQCNPVYEHARSIFDYLLETEHIYTVHGEMESFQTEITSRMRGILIDWLVNVHLKFKLLPDTLYMAVNLIDRFIERKHVLREELQLVGSSAMFIASKYEEIYPPELNDFVFICDNLYTKEQILDMESQIISELQFQLSYTSAYRFQQRYCFLQQSNETQVHCAQYLLELSLIDYSMVQYCPSLQAASALYLINLHFSVGQPWAHCLRLQTRYTQDSLAECVYSMKQTLNKANQLQEQHLKASTELEAQQNIQIAQLEQSFEQQVTAIMDSMSISQIFSQENMSNPDCQASNSNTHINQHLDQLKQEYEQQKKQLLETTETQKSALISGIHKNFASVIRKFSLPRFNQAAKLLLSA